LIVRLKAARFHGCVRVRSVARIGRASRLSLGDRQKDVTAGKNWIVTFPKHTAAESRTLPRLRPSQKRGKWIGRASRLSPENVQKDLTTGKNWIVTFPERAAAEAAGLCGVWIVRLKAARFHGCVRVRSVASGSVEPVDCRWRTCKKI
jgi:hypothetical protein